MRRCFVYEYTCALPTGCPDSLRTEGRAMLGAILDDCARVSGLETVTLLHSSCSVELPGEAVRIDSAEEEASWFRRLAAETDGTLVIAPELDHILLDRCRIVEEVGGHLLGPSAASVRLTADKWILAQHLIAHGVPTPPCLHPDEAITASYPLVWKPRYGAGSAATFLATNPDALRQCSTLARAEGFGGEAVVQPFVEGAPASVAFLIGPSQSIPLLPAAQVLSTDGRFRYQGGRLPLQSALQQRAVDLATRAVNAVPGLFGYAGVDLVLGEAADWVVEINPRLTTSYVGLRAIVAGNLAELLLAVTDGTIAPPPGWRRRSVVFAADGLVRTV